MDPEIFDVHDRTPVANVCNQTLREVVTLPTASIAHVTMDIGDESLLHRHARMCEIYFGLHGSGELQADDNLYAFRKESCVVIPRGNGHRLYNTGGSLLEHFVIAAPPFQSSDVEVLQDTDYPSIVQEPQWHSRMVQARDGAIVHELLRPVCRTELNVSLAIGELLRDQKAMPHIHRYCNEVYYVMQGHGRVQLDGRNASIRPGTVVIIPPHTLHALKNNDSSPLRILCVSSPAYRDDDFHTAT